MEFEILAIYFVIVTFIAVSLSKKQLIDSILIFFLPLNSLSFILYNGLNYPEYHVFTIIDIFIIVLYFKQNKYYIHISIVILLLYLSILIVNTNNYFMYSFGLFRGLLIPYLLYYSLKTMSVRISYILEKLFYSILIGFLVSFVMLLIRGYGGYEILTSNYLRAYGYTFTALGGVNPFAGLLLLILPFYFRVNKTIHIILIVLMIILTMTRGALLVGFLEIIALLVFSKYKISYKSIVTIIMISSVILLSDIFILSRLNIDYNNILYSISTQDNALARYFIWEQTISAMNELPQIYHIVGRGYSTFRDVVSVPGLYDGSVSTPHSVIISIYYNFGIIGIIIIIYYLIKIVYALYRHNEKLILVGIIAFFIYGLIVGVVLFPEYREYANIYSIGIVLIYLVINEKNKLK